MRKVITGSGFRINDAKTRFMSGRGPMIITGITVNNRKLSVGNARKKRLRAQLNNYIRNEIHDDENEIMGMISFIRHIEPQKYESIKNYVQNLKKKTL